MSKLISHIYKEWQLVKKQAQQECENRALFGLAEKYRVCGMLKGTEDIEQIIELFTSLQGVEFCQRYHFPDIQTLRKFKPYAVERFGVFIDAGHISLVDIERVVLIGDTDATIVCDKTLRYDVILMHGARAEIRASGWAVVNVENKNGCDVNVLLNDKARIL